MLRINRKSRYAIVIWSVQISKEDIAVPLVQTVINSLDNVIYFLSGGKKWRVNVRTLAQFIGVT